MTFCRIFAEAVFLSNFITLQSLTRYAVAKVLDYANAKYKKGDFILGFTGWEYNIINALEGLFKIEHTDVPLSYYTGILGKISAGEFLIMCTL